MAYSKQTWANGRAGGTPIDADALDHIEDGIEATALVADAAETPAGAQTKADAAQAAAVAAAATDATTKASAAQTAATAAAATDATTKANAAQAAAVQRANHTGTQPASTISDFNTAAVAAGSGTYPSKVSGATETIDAAWTFTTPPVGISGGGGVTSYFDVKTTYGAVGDGVADDTAEIQAAINAAGAAGGGVVWLPKGTYLTSVKLTMSSPNVTLRGAGFSSQIFANFRNDTDGGYVDVQASNCIVEDLYIKGPGDGGKSIAAIQCGTLVSTGLGAYTGIVVRRVRISDIPGHGVLIQPQAWDGEVSDCQIETCGSTVSVDGHGICVEGSRWRLVNNGIKNCRMRGIELFANSSFNTLTQDTVVAGNVITGCYSYGICLAGIQRATIVGNTINAITGVGIYGGLSRGVFSEVVIADNMVMNNTDAGIRLDAPCEDIVIKGNVVAYNATHGIILGQNGNATTWASFVTVAGNIVRRNGKAGSNVYGVLAQYTRELSITGNTVAENGYGGSANNGQGILVNGNNAGVTITGNRVTDRQTTKTQQYGINMAGTVDYVTVTGNNVQGNGNASFDIQSVAPATNGSIVISGNYGRVQRTNLTLTAPAVPASTVVYSNPFPREATVYVTGGTVSDIAVNGVSTGLTSGAFMLRAGHSITLTYSVAPTWTWLT